MVRNWTLLFQLIMFSSHLVDQTHEVGVSPSSLVQVVRLLQHLGQLLASNVTVERQVRHDDGKQAASSPVGLGPSLDGRGQQGMTKPECKI